MPRKKTQPDHQWPKPGAAQQAVQPPEPSLRRGFGATELVDNPPVHLLHSGVDDRQLVVHDGVPPLAIRLQLALVDLVQLRSWASIRCRIRALNSFSLEVMLVQRSFQPPPLPTLRVVGGHVVLALARHVESRLLQGGDHAGPVLHRAARDAPQQVVPDLVPGIGLMRDPRPQLRRRDVGAVPRLLLPRPRRVIRTAPAVLDVARLDQRAIGLLPARRRDVEALARLQVAPRGEHMHVHAAVGIAVPHRRPRIAIRGQPGPGGLLDLVEHPVDVLVARLVRPWSPAAAAASLR